MKCYQVNGKGIEELALIEKQPPSLVSDNDVLVEVKACSLNYRDVMVAEGKYSLGEYFPFIPLSDMAGVVKRVGKNVQNFKEGDRVLNAPFRHWPAGTLTLNWAKTFIGGAGIDGVLAEQIVYPEDSLVKVPKYLNFIEASTFTIAGLTAWAAIVTHSKTKPGDWVLLQGTGGVSIFAAQLAHAIGAKTIMTTSNDEKAQLVKKQFGIFETVNYRDPNWTKVVKELTEGKGVDVVVDVAGGETLAASLKVCNFAARVAVIGILAGQETVLPIRDILKHQIQLYGIFMESTQELQALMKAAENIQLKPHVDKVFPFGQAREAYLYLREQKHVGKVVIELNHVAQK